MASFVGAIESFNPYIQQIPTEAYTKVGMFQEQQYQAGVQKVQDNIDHIAGLDIANEGGRQYLRARVDELTKGLNKYSTVDFSNPNNVSQLVGLAKPLYQDENIVNDVINTGVYRKWSKDSSEAYKGGKMELGQYARESSDASKWLNSQAAGATYTGRSTPNLSTKKDLVDRIVKTKKDGFEKNEYVYDINYSKDTPYYVKSTNKYYSEADFNNFVTDALVSDRDREMLQNEHWYENQGVSTQALQLQDIDMYQSKIDANNKKIQNLKNDPLIYAGDKKLEAQKAIDDLTAYNTQLSKGKLAYLKGLNLADPSTRDVFHRDLSESRFVNSLDILRDEVKKEEFVKNEQWFKDKEFEIELAKQALKGTTAKGKPKSLPEIIDEVGVYTPVAPDSPKTELSLNVIQKGWQMANDDITTSMNGLIGKLQENGVDLSQFISGWDQTQVGGKAGAAQNVPRFKDQASKDRFYNMVSGLNFAYTKEAEDGHLDNQSFTKFIKENMLGYKDDDPNSKFTFADKMVSDALNTLKGTSALLPRLEKLFADKGVTRTMAQIDESLKNKKDMANAYREALYKSGSLSTSEMASLNHLSDDDILSNNFFLDKNLEQQRAGVDKKVTYGTEKNSDGTYDIYQDTYDNKDAGRVTKFLQNLAPGYGTSDLGAGSKLERRKLAGGFKSQVEAEDALRSEGQLSLYSGISKNSLNNAEKFVKQTYSYVQENLNSTVQNLKDDKPAYSAVQDALTLYMTRARLQASPQDIQVDGVSDLTSLSGITKMEVNGATVSNSEDIFNPNPMYEVQFEASTGEGKDRHSALYSGRVSLKSFLATNPNYKTSQYAQYFAPALYAKQDAYSRIHASVNPLEGSEASYSRRPNIEPVYNRTNQLGVHEYAYDDPQSSNAIGNQYQWETIPIERDGNQTMISYQVVSLGQNTNLGNIKSKDKGLNTYAPGAFYVKMKVPTSTGQPKIMFLKKPNGDSFTFNSASNAHYTIRDLIFNNSEIKMDEVDPNTGVINYFSTDPTTIRGILNAQLSYNGYSKLEPIKIKDALGKEVTKQQANQMQLAK